MTAARAPVATRRPPGLLTAAEVADLWGLSVCYTHARLRSAPRTLYRPPHLSSAVHLFSLRDISPYAPPIRLRAAPSNALTIPDFAARIGVKAPAVMKWIEAGCPVTPGGKRGVFHVHPDSVLAWLEARKDRRMGVHAAKVRELLATREAA